jgi:hypothetical protein
MLINQPVIGFNTVHGARRCQHTVITEKYPAASSICDRVKT